MTLTIPRAGVIGGRAANPQFEAPQTGATIARFGNALSDVGQRIEAERLDREAQRLQLDITRDLGQARLQFEQSNDPDAIDAGWTARVNEIRQGYFAGRTEDGRPRVNPRIAERAGLAFDDLALRHGLALGERAVNLRNSWREAAWTDYRQEVTTQAAAADPDTRATLLAQGAAEIDRLVAAGAIAPDEGARRKLALEADTFNAAAILAVDRDPERALADLQSGAYAGLSAERNAALQVQAQAEMDRRAAAAAAEQEKQTQRQARAINDELDQIAAITAKGRTPQQLALLADPTVRALADPDKLAEAEAAASLMLDRPTLDSLPLADLRQVLAEEQSRPIGRAYEAQRAEVVQKLIDAKAEGLRTDPVAWFQGRGEAFDTPVAFDPDDPAALARALAERQADAALVAQREGVAVPVPLTADERADLKRQAQTLEPAARVDLALTLRGRLGDAATEDITGDRVLGHAAGLALVQGSNGVATRIVRGQQALAENNALLPPAAERVDAAFGVIGGLFADLPGGERHEAVIREAADAYYAAEMRQTDPAGDIDTDRYLQAIHDVLGGTGTYGSRRAAGGIQEVRGRPTILPIGVTADRMEDALSALGQLRVASRRSQQGRLSQDPAQLEQDLIAVSARGRPPRIMGKAPSAETLAYYGLQSVGDGLYAFIRDDGAVLKDSTGQDYVLDARKLLQRPAP